MAKSASDRSIQLSIRLEPKIMTGLKELSAQLGIAPTTIAGIAIGEYVSKNQAVFQNQSQMMETMAKEMARVIGGPLAAIFEGKSAEELNAIFGSSSTDETEEK